MHKIKKVSLFFRVLFQLAFILIPITLAIFWINAPTPIAFFGNNVGFLIDYIPRSAPDILHTLSGTDKLLGFLISLIPVGITEFVLYFLIRLFGLYAKAEIFSINNVNYIKKVGYTLLIGQLLNPIYDGLLSAALTWHNPHGHRFATMTFDGTNVGILLLALLTILISWIMAEGCKLREEQQLTI